MFVVFSYISDVSLHREHIRELGHVAHKTVALYVALLFICIC